MVASEFKLNYVLEKNYVPDFDVFGAKSFARLERSKNLKKMMNSTYYRVSPVGTKLTLVFTGEAIFCPRISAILSPFGDIRTFGDIGTFDHMGTEIKLFSQK